MCEIVHVGIHLGEGSDVEGTGLLGGHVLLLLVVLLTIRLEMLALGRARHARGATLLAAVVFRAGSTGRAVEACWTVARLASGLAAGDRGAQTWCLYRSSVGSLRLDLYLFEAFALFQALGYFAADTLLESLLPLSFGLLALSATTHFAFCFVQRYTGYPFKFRADRKHSSYVAIGFGDVALKHGQK